MNGAGCTMSDNDYLVEMKGISKTFPGVQALDKVDFKLRVGTVHTLMGENGAGKSTLVKCLCGIYTPEEGQILISGKEVVMTDVQVAIQNGISIVQQELSPLLDMTVMENVWIGREPRTAKYFVDHKKMWKDTKALLDDWDINMDPKAKLREYSLSDIQMLEIVKAVSKKAKIIIMDEPTSALGAKEVDKLFSAICRLKEEGVGVIYISHKMDEIFRISDEITVFRDGKFIANHLANMTNNEQLIREMVGRTIEIFNRNEKNEYGDVVLEVENLCSGKEVQSISFKLRKGEMLGIAGLVGAGRTELLKTIYGLRKIDSGKIIINGKLVLHPNPRKSIKNGIALITEDRREEGIIPLMTVADNIAIASLDKFVSRNKLFNKKLAFKTTGKYAKMLDIKTPSLLTKVCNLSGGNQQKVIVARWLMAQSDIFLFDEPTRGIDVGAKAEIHKLLFSLTEQGKSVIIVSSETPEILKVSDRILVMRAGTLSAEMNREDASESRIVANAMIS